MYYRTETIDPRYDRHLGQLKNKTEVKYRCDSCRKESNNELDVRGIFWDNLTSKGYCSVECANNDADNYYLHGFSPCYYPNEERFIFEDNVKTRFALRTGSIDFSKDDHLELAVWLKQVFEEANNEIKDNQGQWKFVGNSDKESYEDVQKNYDFELLSRPELIDFINGTHQLLWNNQIFLTSVLEKQQLINQ